jgi:hypothetical protein
MEKVVPFFKSFKTIFCFKISKFGKILFRSAKVWKILNLLEPFEFWMRTQNRLTRSTGTVARTPHVSPSPPSHASTAAQDRPHRLLVASRSGQCCPLVRAGPPLRLLHLSRWARPLPSTSPTMAPPFKTHRFIGVPPLFARPPFAHPTRREASLPTLLSDQGHRGAVTTLELNPPPPKPPLLSEPLLHTPWIQFAVCQTTSSLPRCYRNAPLRHRPPGATTTARTSPPVPDSTASPPTGYSGELPLPSPYQAGSPSPPRAHADRLLHLVCRWAWVSRATAAAPCTVTRVVMGRLAGPQGHAGLPQPWAD